MQAGIAARPGDVPRVPDRSHPAMRLQLDGLAVGHRRSAAFETWLWRSPGVGCALASQARDRRCPSSRDRREGFHEGFLS